MSPSSSRPSASGRAAESGRAHRPLAAQAGDGAHAVRCVAGFVYLMWRTDQERLRAAGGGPEGGRRRSCGGDSRAASLGEMLELCQRRLGQLRLLLPGARRAGVDAARYHGFLPCRAPTRTRCASCAATRAASRAGRGSATRSTSSCRRRRRRRTSRRLRARRGCTPCRRRRRVRSRLRRARSSSASIQ